LLREERMNNTIPYRLVKELRLAGTNDATDANACVPQFIAAYNGARDYGLRTLKAWFDWLRRKPGKHQKMHNGSMARAPCAVPMSSTSQPN